MLLGHKIKIFIDHKNLTYLKTDHGSEQVLRQRLIIEEFGADLEHIKGVNNVATDTLSRLPMHNNIEYEEGFLNRRVF